MGSAPRAPRTPSRPSRDQPAPSAPRQAHPSVARAAQQDPRAGPPSTPGRRPPQSPHTPPRAMQAGPLPASQSTSHDALVESRYQRLIEFTELEVRVRRLCFHVELSYLRPYSRSSATCAHPTATANRTDADTAVLGALATARAANTAGCLFGAKSYVRDSSPFSALVRSFNYPLSQFMAVGPRSSTVRGSQSTLSRPPSFGTKSSRPSKQPAASSPTIRTPSSTSPRSSFAPPAPSTPAEVRRDGPRRR